MGKSSIFLLVDPHRSPEQLGAQGTTVLVGAAEASWTRGLVERHGAYVRSMVEKMVHDGAENPESPMIDDEDEDHVPHKDIPESQDDESARSVRVRDAFIAVDTNQRLRRAAVSASCPDRLTFEPGDMCYFWRDGVGWSRGITVVCMSRNVNA